MNIQVVLLTFLIIIIGAFATISIAWLAYKLEWKVLFLVIPLLPLLYYFLNEGQDISMYFSPFFIGMMGGLTLRFKKSFLFYLVTSTMIMLVLSTGSAFYLKQYKNIDNVEVSKKVMTQMIAESEIPADAKGEILTNFESDFEFIKDKIIFLNFLSILFFSLICYNLIKRFFFRFNEILETKGLEYFKLNDYFIFVLIFSWGLYLLLKNDKYYYINIIALNVALIASVFYFIQAIGVIKFYILKKGWPSYIIPMMFMMILVLGGGGIIFFSVLLAGFGSLDLWADFRKINISAIGNNVENNKENQE